MSDHSSGSVFEEQTPATQPQEENTQQTQEPQTPPAEPQQSSAQSDSVFADQLASIKNESGEPKYRDLPTALDALKHSQEYIPQLKSENETLKQEVERLKEQASKVEQMEETLNRLAASKSESEEAPQGTQGLTPEQIQDLLDNRLQEREQQAKVQANLSEVEQALSTQFGEKAQEVVAQKAQEYGMTPADLKSWAEKSPQAVLALFNAKSSAQGGKSKPSSSVNIPPVAPNNEIEVPKLSRYASSKERVEQMAAIKRRVYQQYGVEE